MDEAIYFETSSDQVLPAMIADAYEENQLYDTNLFPNGNEGYCFISVKVSATKGRSESESLGTSNGTAYQQFAINSSSIIDGTKISPQTSCPSTPITGNAYAPPSK